jgi:serine/threonine protein kinase
MQPNQWKIIEQSFHETLDLPPASRVAYIKDKFAAQTEIRDAILNLLNHVDSTQALNSIVEQAAHSVLDTEEDLSDSMAGSYRLMSRLGQGGMGAVYLAERADKQYQKQVAIKLIRTTVNNQSLMQRFREERQILANLEHANITRLLDGGSTESGIPFLVMEYVEGLAIDDYCQQQKLSLKQRLRLFQKVCDAVQYAHQHLVVHCDLKPSNILITADGEPKLLDFGISKLLNSVAAESPPPGEQQVKSRMLTLQYSSPEQIRGESINTASDVYSLGVILYELLSGYLPFTKGAKTLEQTILHTQASLPSLIVQQQSSKLLDHIFESTSKQLSRDLKGDIDSIVMKSICQEAKGRYESVYEFSMDLERYLDYWPISAGHNSWFKILAKFFRRNRISSSFAAAFIIAVSGFTAKIWLQSEQLIVERDMAKQQSNRAEATTKFLSDMFTAIEPDNAKGREVSVREIVDKASDKLQDSEQHALVNQPLVESTIRRTIGVIYEKLGFLPQAESHLKHALSILNPNLITEQQEYLRALMGLTNVYTRQFKYHEAEPLALESLALSKLINGESHRDTLGIMNNIGGIYQGKGELDKALEVHIQNYNFQVELHGELHPDTILAITNIGIAHHWLGNYADAERRLRRCLTLSREVNGELHSRTLYCMSVLGSLLEVVGKFDEATIVIEEHIEKAIHIFGEMHPDTLRSMHNLAMTYHSLNRLDEAEQLYLQVLSRRRDVLGPQHIETLQTQMRLSLLYS